MADYPTGIVTLPGFCDVHVHFREPGFSYKETIASGTAAAARGGYTTVCAMPNLDPAPDTLENLAIEQKLIAEQALIEVLPYATITLGEKGVQLVDMAALKPHVVAFSDDGKGVQSTAIMGQAMKRAKEHGVIIAEHCEDEFLMAGGCIHDGAFAAEHGYKGVSSESEYSAVMRDIRIAGYSGAAFHVCHISTYQSVQSVRDAKAAGLDVTCEATPHHLLLDETYLQEDGRFKMNPPLRGVEDREALVRALQDGTVDFIATDHAPHSAEEKARGLEGSPFGVVGLETAFPLLYTYLVCEGVITFERLMELMVTKPRERFGLPAVDETKDYSVWDLDAEYEIDPADFASMGKSTPFAGWKVYGRCLKTVHNGKVVYQA